MKTRRFRPATSRDLVLLDSRATDREYEPIPDGEDGETREGIAIVNVCGPLEHHESFWFDSYESIERRAQEAFESDARAVVLVIDSPGGLASGMVETSRALRRLADRSGKPFFAYANEQICSAAYGIACAADEIWCPETGEVGSVGVILPVVDQTAAMKRMGVRVELLTTGARKGDGHPDKPLTDDVRRSLQSRVDQIGDAFFGMVEASRGMDPRRLQAEVFIGKRAVKAGLADGVADWPTFLDLVERASQMTGSGLSSGFSLDSRAKMGSPAMRGSDLTRRTNAMAKASKSNDPKLLELTKAVAAIEGQIETCKSRKERSSLLRALADATEKVTAWRMKKTTKRTVETEEEDDDEDDDKDDDDDSEEGSRADSEESEEEGRTESEEESEEESDKGEKKARKAKKASAISSDAPRGLAAHVESLTGKRGQAAMGALDGIFAKAKAYDAMADDVAALKADKRRAEVEGLITRALDEKKVAPANAQFLAILRETGAKSPRRLSAMIEALPRIVPRTLADGPLLPATNAKGEVVRIDIASLDDATRGIIEGIAKTTGLTLEKAAEQYAKTAQTRN